MNQDGMNPDGGTTGLDRAWSLHDLLSIPYLVHASTVEAGSSWVRQASYPELPGCTVQAPTIEEALRLLERRRIEIIIATVQGGLRPTVPRPPLAGCDPHSIAAETGLQNELSTALAREAAEMRE